MKIEKKKETASASDGRGIDRKGNGCLWGSYEIEGEQSKNKRAVIVTIFKNLGSKTNCKTIHANHRNCENKDSLGYLGSLV